MDASGTVVAWNEAAERLTGYAASAWVGRSLQGLTTDDPDLATRLADALRQQQPVTLQVQIRASSGDPRPVVFEITPHALGAILVHRATSRVPTNAGMEGFCCFVEEIPAAAWITDHEGRIVYLNPAYRKTLRLPAEVDPLRGTIADLFPPSVAEHYLANIRNVIASETTLQWTEPGQRGNGDAGMYLVTMFPLQVSGRPLIGGLALDVTDQAGLRAALQMRDRAIYAVSQGILVTNALVEDNPIIYASPGFERLTGYPMEEILGKNCRFLQGPKTDVSTLAEFRRAVQEGRAFQCEILNYRKDGTPFWNEVSISPVRDNQGRVVQFVGVQTDVTTRKRLESQLREAQKLEAIGRLAGGVAHDFNNLLTVISGFSDLLLADTEEHDPRRASLMAIRDAGERAASLTRQLLAFGRKQVLEPQLLDLNDIVIQTERMLRRLIGEDIALQTDLAPALRPVLVDPGQIEQVILNLCINSRDAMPEGGRLTLTTQNRTLTEADREGFPDALPGDYIELSVSDTGSGMTESVKANLFEPFFTTKEFGKGTGLGLAVVHGVVKQSGGYITVVSEPGRGSAFHIIFPVAQAVPTRPSGVISHPALRGTETILLVEDEEPVRRIARISLEA